MLHWEEDVIPMINTTSNSRDVALISVAWDSGARSGELQNLTIGSINDHRHCLQITVNGKMDQRTVMLVTSIPYLTKWLDDHPAPEEPSAPLWSKLGEAEDMSYQMFAKIFKWAGKDAGINNPVTPTNFRKSSASHLASQNVNQAHLEDLHGWKRGSDIAPRYISVFSQDTDREIARAHGAEIEEEQESDPIAPVDCPRCSKETPRDKSFCVWCHQAISPEAVEELRQQERNVRDSILKIVRNDPSLLDDIEKYQTVMNILEDDPALYEDAESFLQALGES